jgi:integrase
VVALPEHVHCVKAKGKLYYYYHLGRGTTKAGKRVRLPNDPNLPEFWQAYDRLISQQPEETGPAPWTIDALINAYKLSPDFSAKSQRTQKEYERYLQMISTILGPLNVRTIRPKHVLQLRDSFAKTPRQADYLVSVLSLLIGWGVPRDFADVNPCREISNLSRTDGYAPWEWEDIEYAHKHLPQHLWWPAALALYTGQRQSDVLAMNWGAITRGEISVRQSKTGKTLLIPLHSELAAILETIPRISTRILTNSRGVPWETGFRAAWQKAMNRSAFNSFRDRRLVFHGLRKSAVVMLIESGCTDGEVAAITGQSRQMVEHYSVLVNQRRLARAAILKWQASGAERTGPERQL